MANYSGLFDGEYGSPYANLRKKPGQVTGLSRNLFAITPSDSVNLARIADGLYVGSAGTISLVDEQGNTISRTFVAGWHPIRVKKVNATGTTATSLMGG